MKTVMFVALFVHLIAVPMAEEDPTVQAVVGTEPVGGADGVAIWKHPTDPAKSTVIGANPKKGIAVFSLDGKVLQRIDFPKGGGGGVDVRGGFSLGGETVFLVAGGKLKCNSLFVYKVDPAKGTLVDVLAGPVATKAPPYGSCLYHSAKSGKYHLFITSKAGVVEQYELTDGGEGKVEATLIRTLRLEAEGDRRMEACVADDETGVLYVAQENENNIWKFGAEPDGESKAVLVASAKLAEGDNVEGLAIVPTGPGKGWLLVSVQGSWRYRVYTREGPHKPVTKFRILTAAGEGEVESDDCIEVIEGDFGPQFPGGLFVTQNTKNQGGFHFQLVPWKGIREIIEKAVAGK